MREVDEKLRSLGKTLLLATINTRGGPKRGTPHARLSSVAAGAGGLLHRGRNIERGTLVEEAGGFQREADVPGWHYGPVFEARNVMMIDGVPDHDVRVFNATV